MVVGHDDQRAVAEGSGRERVVDGDDAAAVDALPVFHGADGFLVRETVSFESSEAVRVAVLAGRGFVHPAWIGEYRDALVVAGVESDEGVVVVHGWELGVGDELERGFAASL